MSSIPLVNKQAIAWVPKPSPRLRKYTNTGIGIWLKTSTTNMIFGNYQIIGIYYCGAQKI